MVIVKKAKSTRKDFRIPADIYDGIIGVKKRRNFKRLSAAAFFVWRQGLIRIMEIETKERALLCDKED